MIKKLSVTLCVIILISTFASLHVFSVRDSDWVTNVSPPQNYDYSFAVLGDTQNLIRPDYHNTDNYVAMYDWIIDNVDSQKIKFVMGLGDITEHDTNEEWAFAKNARTKLCKNGILNSFIRGNHDNNESRFKSHFSYSEFGSTVTGTYNNNMLNTYTKFSAGNVKYIVFALTIGPNDSILNWASNIISQNPDHNVIITTHIYLSDKAKHTSAPSPNDFKYYGTSGGEQIWDKLVRKHENIVLVLSGHYTLNKIARRQIAGDNGNLVTEMMIDAENPDEELMNQGGAGLVAMFYFSNNGRKLDVRYYSTVHKKYFMSQNQFSYNLNVVGLSDSEETTTSPVTTTPNQQSPLPTETTTQQHTTSSSNSQANPEINSAETDLLPSDDTEVPSEDDTLDPETTIISDTTTLMPETTDIPKEEGTIESVSDDQSTPEQTDIPSSTESNHQNNKQNHEPKQKQSPILWLLLISFVVIVITAIIFFIKKRKNKHD